MANLHFPFNPAAAPYGLPRATTCLPSREAKGRQAGMVAPLGLNAKVTAQKELSILTYSTFSEGLERTADSEI